MNADVHGKTSSVQDNLLVPTSGPEMSVRNYHYTLCNNPEECRSQEFHNLNSSLIYTLVSNSRMRWVKQH